MRRRLPLSAVLGAVVVTTGVLGTVFTPHEPQLSTGVLSLAANVESSAFYCTGLTDTQQGASGDVTIVNTARVARTVSYSISDELGSTPPTTIRVPAHQSVSIAPATVLKSSRGYGFSAEVSGGGVFGEERISGSSSQERCSASGVTSWYDAGLDTTVGSQGYISVLNPTATPAVFNVTTYSPLGYSAPQPFQGVAVPAHSQVQVDLGAQIVNTPNVGVHVKVLRGALVISGVEVSGSTASFSTGDEQLTTSALFPLVTTTANASATIDVLNPTDVPVQVTMNVSLKQFQIAPQVVTVEPYSSAHVVITPNPAIPAAGQASVAVTSTSPVVASLYEGSTSGLSLSSAEQPTSEVAVLGQTGTDIFVTNTSTKTVRVTVTALGASRSEAIEVSGGTATDVSRQVPWVTSDEATLLTAPAATLQVTQLNTSARVPVVVSP